MSIIQIDSPLVKLQGFTFTASILIYNPHNILAVIFELESKSEFLQIQPKRGMIMKHDKEIIRLKCKPQFRQQLYTMQKERNEVIVRASYFSEYNRKLMAINQIRGWSAISKEIQEVILPVYFNVSEQISKVKFYHSNIHSSNIKRVNSQSRLSSIRSKDSKLNQDLDFIFRNQSFKSKYIQTKEQSQVKIGNVLKTNSEEQPTYSKDLIPISNNKQIKTKRQNNRGFQLILLSIASVLFLCLGKVFGNIYKN